MYLMRDLLLVHALADQLQIGALATTDACWSMAVGAAARGKELCTTSFCFRARSDRGDWMNER